MNVISGTAKYYYEHLAEILVGAMQVEHYFCMRNFKRIIGHGSNQREVIKFTCHDRTAPHGNTYMHEEKEYKEFEDSAVVLVQEIDVETSKVTIIGDADKAWRKVTDIIRATGYVEFDEKKKKTQNLKWKKDIFEYNPKDQIRSLFFEAMDAFGQIPENTNEMRRNINIFLLRTPRDIDDRIARKGVFIDWCVQEMHWKGKLVETKKRPDLPIRGNIKGFDLDTLLKWYRKNVDK